MNESDANDVISHWAVASKISTDIHARGSGPVLFCYLHALVLSLFT